MHNRPTSNTNELNVDFGVCGVSSNHVSRAGDFGIRRKLTPAGDHVFNRIYF